MIIKTLYIMFMCLIITIVIEMLFAYILKVRDKIDFLNILLVNILTNPILVITTYMIGIFSSKLNKDIATYIFEVLVVLTEGYIYKKVLKYKKDKWIYIIINFKFKFIFNWTINNFIK